jgi:guanylate kinase
MTTMTNVTTTGTLYIVSAPSGAGKTSLLKELLAIDDRLEISISHTTRKMREGENKGVDYHFVDQVFFKHMVANNEFVEHAHVFGHSYGTSAAHIQEDLDKGIDVILEIDWQGAEQVKLKFPNCTSIFILPPSKDELYQRLTHRGQDSEEIITGRMEQAVNEMIHYHQYDYIIVNDDFSMALNELKSIVQSKRLEKDKQVINLEKLIHNLVG